MCQVAVYSCPVDSIQTETKGTVLIKSAAELKAFSKGEEDLLQSQIQAIHEAGVTVIVSGSKFGEMAQHFLNKLGIMTVKVVSKHDLRRLCQAIGATPLPRLTPPSPSELGHCDSVVVEEVIRLMLSSLLLPPPRSALLTLDLFLTDVVDISGVDWRHNDHCLPPSGRALNRGDHRRARRHGKHHG